MNKRKKNLMLTFVMAILATAIALPMLSALGVPSFSVVLVSLFGGGNIFALIFSLILILSIGLSVGKLTKSIT
ncbi:hypothetical protein [Bacillus mesophilum]|uniref:Uncharacterized protein n=1 Tax=Bacillus mesophilum TaxID=1071718 RepID=A0A7V7RK27_9BACI|nr:hypothetical protein [Bacillus mesophilum]KAB2331372.1 hypothetical protein F7732_16115 [Bacillus mesophilum]